MIAVDYKMSTSHVHDMNYVKLTISFGEEINVENQGKEKSN